MSDLDDINNEIDRRKLEQFDVSPDTPIVFVCGHCGREQAINNIICEECGKIL